MKKVILFISLITIALIGFKINISAHSPYYHANVFDLSTQVVNFGDSDYYVLRSPYRDTISEDFKIYESYGINILDYVSKGSNNINTSSLTNGQFDYTSIASLIHNRLLDNIDFFNVYLSDLFTTTYNELDLSVSYTLDIDYVSSTPFNVIWSYSGTKWNNGWNVPVNNLVYGLKVQFFGYVDDSDNAYNYVSVYFYDVNGIQISGGGSFNYFQGDTFNLGLAVKPHNIDLETAYQDGYDYGFDNGVLKGEQKGFRDGFEKGEEKGFRDGFEKGEEKGFNDGTALETDVRPMFQTLITFIGSVFMLMIFPGVTIGTLASIPIMFALFKWFMKMFGGK